MLYKKDNTEPKVNLWTKMKASKSRGYMPKNLGGFKNLRREKEFYFLQPPDEM